MEDQSDRAFSAVWRSATVVLILAPLQYMLQSSANSVHFMGGFMLLNMSLMATRNNVTLIDDPCGSPFSMSRCSESVLPSFTWIFRSRRKL
ncbi:unnamed protein product [Macrosiphum euphorbiae]|uniref:Uncharacterized protein n=1 Tax=Macrosiphum euphorbiae TaxID=13131 RepID=A0AAV0VVB2_9HEMI|nr:unnamed protein product [Macrosiphum euphorbiae]CAI6349817.1 unnamed protein product [Macrosiphum euphorbiae]CAI6350144.1 unnamed protein product [Macrosiphum euphorbiae]CAI6351627.1 unnamed protein product [Macrosiphum euphorbiae]CAI6369298.1 unnamed protein product [Macrosiphum euphorbiae]